MGVVEAKPVRSALAIGVAIRPGATKPDLRSAEAFKQSLRSARAIGITDASLGVAASVYVVQLIQKLGMTDELKQKLKAYPADAYPKPIISGEVDFWLTQASEVVQTTSVEYARSLPADLQNYTIFTAGVAANTKNAPIMQDLLRYFSGPLALPTIKAKGMEPG